MARGTVAPWAASGGVTQSLPCRSLDEPWLIPAPMQTFLVGGARSADGHDPLTSPGMPDPE